MSTDSVITTTSLGRRFRGRWVVQDLDLEVPKGSVFGFLGLNGAGKSTTIRMLMGLLARHQGDARVLGLDPGREPVEIKRRVGYVPEAPIFYDWMTIGQTLDFAACYRSKEWDRARADHLLAHFRLPRDARINELSKGMKAKTSLVLAMAFNPELLVLDEPTSGLDPIARREFIEGILAEYQESGRTVFVSSHIVSELAGLVDHVGILHEGRLLFAQTAEEFLAGLRRVRMDFEGPAPTDFRLSGLLTSRSNGRDAEAAVRSGDEKAIAAEVEALGARGFTIEPLPLEDAFIEVVRAAERGSV